MFVLQLSPKLIHEKRLHNLKDMLVTDLLCYTKLGILEEDIVKTVKEVVENQMKEVFSFAYKSSCFHYIS
jgi:hypothetical protein